MYDNEGLNKLLIASALLLSVFAVGVGGYSIIGQGHWSFLDCAYMTMITLSTVGYGEVIDISSNPVARVFTIALILFGMGTILFFVSSMTAFVVEGQLQNILRRKRMHKQIGKLDNHIILCGVGETGVHIAEELQSTGTPFIMIDENEDRLEHICESFNCEIPYVIGDATEDHILLEAGVERAKGVIAACTSDKENLFIVVSARQINPNLRIVAKVVDVNARKKFVKAGANTVVTTNYIGGLRMASEMIRPTVASFLDRMMRDKEQLLRIDEVNIPSGSHFIGKKLMDLDIHRKTKVAIIAVKDQESGKYSYNPGGSFILKNSMCLICMGEVESMHQLRAMVGQE